MLHLPALKAVILYQGSAGGCLCKPNARAWQFRCPWGQGPPTHAQPRVRELRHAARPWLSLFLHVHCCHSTLRRCRVTSPWDSPHPSRAPWLAQSPAPPAPPYLQAQPEELQGQTIDTYFYQRTEKQDICSLFLSQKQTENKAFKNRIVWYKIGPKATLDPALSRMLE